MPATRPITYHHLIYHPAFLRTYIACCNNNRNSATAAGSFNSDLPIRTLWISWLHSLMTIYGLCYFFLGPTATTSHWIKRNNNSAWSFRTAGDLSQKKTKFSGFLSARTYCCVIITPSPAGKEVWKPTTTEGMFAITAHLFAEGRVNSTHSYIANVCNLKCELLLATTTDRTAQDKWENSSYTLRTR